MVARDSSRAAGFAGDASRSAEARKYGSAEGYATALSVLEALHVLYRDARVLVVFSANGMKALTPRRARVIADNDPYLLPGMPGKVAQFVFAGQAKVSLLRE